MKLRLAVVDDPALAAAVVRLQGEWNAQTGAEMQVEEIAEKDFASDETLSTDAVICPSYLLGRLAERKLIAAVPGRILSGSQWADLFDLVKLREAAWGTEVMAVPFGSPLLTIYYRADLLEKMGRRPPRTWEEYRELGKLLADEKPAGADVWCGAIEPLGGGWAGLTLLARAAPLAKHRDNFSTLFNVATMEPLVAEAAVVQALERLVADRKFGPTDPFGYDPAAARAAFWRGECGMALTWPTAAEPARGEGSAMPEKVDPSIRVGFVELPGSRSVFNLTGHVWDRRGEDEDSQVPLLAAAGRLGVANAKSEHLDAAFQLLLWLSDETMSVQVSTESPATTMFRQSHLRFSGRWVEKPVGALAAAQYGDVVDAAFRHEQWLGALRIPGRAEYLAALDEAVKSAVEGEKSALDALLDADAKWVKITERLGEESQKAAYRHSLGLE